MTQQKHYTPGDWYQIDDIAGIKIRASSSRQQWDGLVTEGHRFSDRNPQDFVTGVRDDQSVPLPRPRQTNQFTVVETWVTAYAARGSAVISVANTQGFFVGDNVLVMTDNGENFSTTVLGIGGGMMTLAANLPHSVGGNFGDPIENAVFRVSGNAIAGTVFILDVTGHDVLDFNVLA